ncbi:MAG: SH3 domain-containing protein, partial [Chloroflexota bacterium]
PTQTVTPEPTPVWARVSARDGDGAFVRDEPNGTVLTSLFNGSLVQVISEPMRGQGTTLWVKVRTDTGLEGWMMQALLATATPAPNW